MSNEEHRRGPDGPKTSKWRGAPGTRTLSLFALYSSFFVLLLSACQQQVVREPGMAYYEKAVHDLARPEMEGRAPGTAGLERARDYLVDHFQRIGLEPAFGDSYLQGFQVDIGHHLQNEALAITGAEEPETPAKPAVEFSTLGMSASGEFEGELVFLGYGVHNEDKKFDSYRETAKGAIKGKVAIVFRFEPMNGKGVSLWTNKRHRWTKAAAFVRKAKRASEMGAVALLVVDPPSHPLSGRLRSVHDTAAGKDVGIPVLHIRQSLLEKMLVLAGRDSAATLATWQKKADSGHNGAEVLTGARVRGQVRLEARKVTVHNVAGLLPGRGKLAEQMVVVGAHYDHLGLFPKSNQLLLHPGADDNASGTAGILLLAQHRADRQRQLFAPERCTIAYICFTAEEKGLLGSTYYMKHLDEMNLKAERIVAMLNMDMIGRIKDNQLLVLGTSTASQWDELIRQANRSVGLDIRKQKAVPANSDHAPFVRNKIPALHIFSGFHSDYHQPTDTADKINIKGAVRTLKWMNQLIDQVSTAPQRLAFTGKTLPDPHAAHGQMAKRGDSGGDSGNGARLGILPDYFTTENQDGSGISEVYPDTAAEKAGLQSGDRIIAWNDQTIANVHDLTDALQSSRPGDEVAIKIMRKDKQLEIKVTLGRRP